MIHAFLITLAVLAAIWLFPYIFVLTGGAAVLLWRVRYVLLALVAALIGWLTWDYQTRQAQNRQEQAVAQRVAFAMSHRPFTEFSDSDRAVYRDEFYQYFSGTPWTHSETDKETIAKYVQWLDASLVRSPQSMQPVY